MINYPAADPIRTLPHSIHATVRVPGSKSITNRALVLAALCGADCTLTGALQCEDTEVMVDSLQKLGLHVTAEWPRVHLDQNITGRKVLATHANLFVANSGTSMRFLAALCAVGEGHYRLDGVPRMRERPIRDLLDALNQLGAKAISENNNGCPPIVMESHGLRGDEVRIKADVSSQFLSALLMAAPFAHSDVTIRVDGPTVSEPYIDMTLKMMEQFDLHGTRNGNVYQVRAGNHAHQPMTYAIEPDASAASYFFAAAAIAGGSVTVPGMKKTMLQGDIRFVDVLQQMGCDVTFHDDRVRVSFDPLGRTLTGVDVDMNEISDTVMTLAAVACFASSPTTIRNVAHIRHKETDRIAALATELRKLGVMVEEFHDGLRIAPRPMTGCALDTYNDHRMAMSLALIGLKVPGVVINNPGCVAKTYPGFWQDFESLYDSAS